MNRLVCPSCQQPARRGELVSFSRQHPPIDCVICRACLQGLLARLFVATTNDYPVGTE